MTLTNQNTNDLIALCKASNQLAQMEIYNRYYKAMYNTAMRIVNSPSLAEDIMQDAFIAAFSKLNTLRDHNTFGSWLKRIVINQSIKEYKLIKSRAEVSIEDHLYKIENESESNDGIYTTVSINDIKSAMNSLKSNYKIILSLNCIEGYDQEEICDIMQISHANCRTMLSRAKDKLKQQIISTKEKPKKDENRSYR